MDHNGVLHVVFDFLGYRSLSRASMCCKAWRSAACSNSRWCRLYFHKFKGALLEEELDVFNFLDFYPRWAHDLDERIIHPMSREGYDWFIIFKHNYIAEKFARRHAMGTKWNRVCPFVGCNMCIVSEYRWNTHLNNHVKQWHAWIKKKDKLQALRVKASKLKQALSPGLEHSNAVKLPGRKKSKMETPESVLNIVFAFLDIKDLNRVRSVCKLWTEQSNSLWYEVYCRYFGEPNVKWISAPRYQCNWKRLFEELKRLEEEYGGSYPEILGDIVIISVTVNNIFFKMRRKLSLYFALRISIFKFIISFHFFFPFHFTSLGGNPSNE
jgi:hypothetical protein